MRKENIPHHWAVGGRGSADFLLLLDCLKNSVRNSVSLYCFVLFIFPVTVTFHAASKNPLWISAL